jgi:hypothetical protein
MNVAVYKNESNEMRVVNFSPNALIKYSEIEISERSIPIGVPFLIIDSVDVPSNLEEWAIDTELNPDGYGKLVEE